MTFAEILGALRRRWPLVLAVPLLAALVSLAVALAVPPRYSAAARLLVTRSEDRRFDTEDALAYDLPAIVSGEPFAQELSAELAARGVTVTPEQARAAMSAANQRRVVTVVATAGDAATAEAMLAAAVELVQARGLALWGDPAATPEDTGLNAVALDGIPPRAAPSGGLRSIALDAALRALVGLGAGVALALALERVRLGA